jgi:hypothetical protein
MYYGHKLFTVQVITILDTFWPVLMFCLCQFFLSLNLSQPQVLRSILGIWSYSNEGEQVRK